jgi:hypothetical protein
MSISRRQFIAASVAATSSSLLWGKSAIAAVEQIDKNGNLKIKMDSGREVEFKCGCIRIWITAMQ